MGTSDYLGFDEYTTVPLRKRTMMVLSVDRTRVSTCIVVVCSMRVTPYSVSRDTVSGSREDKSPNGAGIPLHFVTNHRV
jgi:hypothetical protein